MRDPNPVKEDQSPPSNPPGATARLEVARLKRRADFLRVGKGRRWHGKGFTLQAATAEGNGPSRIGFTVTKKVGCSVVRNRARRRLREAVRLGEGLCARPGYDYVIVARLDAIRLPFPTLRRDLRRALDTIHGDGRSREPARPNTKPRP